MIGLEKLENQTKKEKFFYRQNAFQKEYSGNLDHIKLTV